MSLEEIVGDSQALRDFRRQLFALRVIGVTVGMILAHESAKRLAYGFPIGPDGYFQASVRLTDLGHVRQWALIAHFSAQAFLLALDSIHGALDSTGQSTVFLELGDPIDDPIKATTNAFSPLIFALAHGVWCYATATDPSSTAEEASSSPLIR